MWAPPTVRGGPAARWLSPRRRALALFAVGIVLLLESGSGCRRGTCSTRASPSTRRSRSASRTSPSRSSCSPVAWALGARVGVGTVANALLIGLFVDGLLRSTRSTVSGRAARGADRADARAGILVIGVGSGLYMGAGMGAGPRDSLMLVARRSAPARASASSAPRSRSPSRSSGSRSAGRSGSARSPSRWASGRRSSSRSGCSSTRRSPTPRPTCRTPVTAASDRAVDEGLVCAGGEATRLGELTRVTNKHLLPVGSWPMVYYPLQLLQLRGRPRGARSSPASSTPAS